MFQLTRQVRFSIGAAPIVVAREQSAAPPSLARAKAANGHGGWPVMAGMDAFYTIDITVAGDPETDSQYVVNIVDLDALVRQHVIALFAGAPRGASPAPLLLEAMRRVRTAMPAPSLVAMRWWLSPYFSLTATTARLPMIALSQRFEFSASHRLHNPKLSEAENRALFGKCNNPHGHGHNYEVEVKLRGAVGASGQIMPTDTLEKIVAESAINRLDHRYLNVELPEFAALIPTVENIAMVIYRWLSPALKQPGCELASVTVWETPKTWCEYSE